MQISSFIEDIYYIYFDSQLHEMANLQPHETGLKPVIFVSGKGGAKHGPRIKVSNVAGTYDHNDNFTITAEHEPRVIGKCKLHPSHLQHVVDWVKMNHEHLHHIWHNYGIMSADEVANGFRKT